MSRLPHDRVTRNPFTALRILWAPTVHAPFPPQPRPPLSALLLFPECHRVGIGWYAFKVPSCLFVTWRLISLYCWILFHCLEVPQFGHPIAYRRASSCLFLSFGNYAQSCYGHPYAGLHWYFNLPKKIFKKLLGWFSLFKKATWTTKQLQHYSKKHTDPTEKPRFPRIKKTFSWMVLSSIYKKY